MKYTREQKYNVKKYYTTQGKKITLYASKHFQHAALIIQKKKKKLLLYRSMCVKIVLHYINSK